MARIIDRRMVCGDCLIVISYGTADTVINEPPEREATIREAVARLPGAAYPTDKEITFSRSPCGCCGSPLAGGRYEIVILASGVR